MTQSMSLSLYLPPHTHSPPAILGVTNPFFAKALQHWPHVVRIGDSPASPLRSALTGGSRNKLPASLVARLNSSPLTSGAGLTASAADLGPGVHTKYKPFLRKDRSLLSKITQGIERQRPSEVQSALIRRHLMELTQSFLMPLERYLASLMPLAKSLSPFKSAPAILPFNQDDFFKLLLISGPQLTSGIKGDWTSLYR